MHYIRLLYECRELLQDKRLTLPRPEKDLLIAVRSGKYTQTEVFAMGEDLRVECDTLLDNSDLPDVPDVKLLSRIVSKAYLKHWS